MQATTVTNSEAAPSQAPAASSPVVGPPPPAAPMLEVAEAAIARLRIVAEEQGIDLVGVRVGVSGGGCSGLSYMLDFEKTPRLGDSVFGDNPKIFVDRKSLVFLRGTMLDFEGGLNGKGFVFKNPNAKASCGCGSSFSV